MNKVAGVDASEFDKKSDLASLKADVEKLDIDKSRSTCRSLKTQ